MQGQDGVPHPGTPSPPTQPPERPARRADSTIIRRLTGSLPCVRCKYDLQGLSIRVVCPECGTPVRATLLAVVDPMAKELLPIARPRWVGNGLALWSTAALLAVLAAWTLWIWQVISPHSFSRIDEWLRAVVLLATFASGVGAASLIDPHAGIKPINRRLTMLGVGAYAPLLLMLWVTLYDPAEATVGVLMGSWVATSFEQSVRGLVVQLLLLAIILCLRHNARLLAARSMLLRTGRVDRQTMLALAGVLLVSLVGGVLTLAAAERQAAETLLTVGRAAVLAGAVLFTVGLVGVVVDCWRIRPVVLQPPLSLEGLVSTPTPRGQ